MASPLRIVLASYSARGFAVPHAVCTDAGHIPVAYVYARSLRPRSPNVPSSGARVSEILEAIPAGMDLLLLGSAEGLARALPGYLPDLVVCNGFPWKVPAAVLAVPRLGFINVHPSLLPKYRGPIPIHWAIRNGDPEIGVTVHWMDEHFDTGRVLAQDGGIPLEDDVDRDRLFDQIGQVTADLLHIALERVCAGVPGEPQSHTDASYAGWMERDFHLVDWSRGAREIHNQVRTFRFGVVGARGPLAKVDGAWMTVLRTQIEPAGGTRVQCADGPLWIVESEPANPPAPQVLADLPEPAT